MLAVYILPREIWHVLTVEAFAPAKNLRSYPDIECKCARWEEYREAWHLLRGECGERCKGWKDWRRCFLDGVGMGARAERFLG